MEDLQDVADDLAATIGRGVAIDDRRLRLLVHSAHDGDADAMRRTSILTRSVPETISEYAFSHGIEKADGPIRVPAEPSLAVAARLVFPLRSQGLLLGFLTVLDSGDDLSEADVRACSEAASLAGAIRYRQRLLHEAERDREHQLVRSLLFDEGDARRIAAARISDEGLLTSDRVTAVVIAWSGAPELDVDGVQMLIRRALDKTRRTVSPGAMVEFVRPNQAVVLAATPDAPAERGREIAAKLLELVRHLASAADLRLVAAFGDDAPLSSARASYEQALRALHVAGCVPGLPTPVGWTDLGVNRVLAQFPLDAGALDEIPEGCRVLFEHPVLLHTIERYLDLACDAKRTASELSLHRASFYSRLRKAERVTGLSLRNGEDRLALHLGIRLLRLAGITPGGAR